MKWLLSVMFGSAIAIVMGGGCYPASASEPPKLTPFDEFLGSFETMKVGEELCYFYFNPYIYSERGKVTTLAPGTRLSVDPPIEIYGAGSVINKADGMTCSACAVKSMVMDGPTGVITFYCEGASNE